jgi:hypothetical protein
LPVAGALDHLIANLFRAARELGVPHAAVRARLRQWVEFQPPGHFLLIVPVLAALEFLPGTVAAPARARLTCPSTRHPEPSRVFCGWW